MSKILLFLFLQSLRREPKVEWMHSSKLDRIICSILFICLYMSDVQINTFQKVYFILVFKLPLPFTKSPKETVVCSQLIITLRTISVFKQPTVLFTKECQIVPFYIVTKYKFPSSKLFYISVDLFSLIDIYFKNSP